MTTKVVLGTTMADRNGLKFLGLLFASVTLSVMLTTAFVVKGHADGHFSMEADAVETTGSIASPAR